MIFRSWRFPVDSVTATTLRREKSWQPDHQSFTRRDSAVCGRGQAGHWYLQWVSGAGETDFLPGPLAGRTGQTATLTNNDSGRFTDRWVQLEPPKKQSKCIWTRGIEPLDLPIAHGEGKFIRQRKIFESIVGKRAGRAGVCNGSNHNGSVDDIAGVCDATGLVFGLMPHPERYIEPFAHPAWTSQKPLPAVGRGLQIFENAVRLVEGRETVDDSNRMISESEFRSPNPRIKSQ